MLLPSETVLLDRCRGYELDALFDNGRCGHGMPLAIIAASVFSAMATDEGYSNTEPRGSFELQQTPTKRSQVLAWNPHTAEGARRAINPCGLAGC